MGNAVSSPLPPPRPTSYMVTKANQFLGQKPDYEWFIAEKGGAHGEDIYEHRIVVTTFPITLTKADFDDYVENKFCDREENIRKKITALFKVNTDCDIEKNISFNYESNGKISAVLTQILYEKLTSTGEIKISVGYSRYIRQTKTNSQFEFEYWKSNEERVTKALQFLYGNTLLQELSLA
ncbi:unnamed protein product [Adineta steineri]|uniref:Uncharacterized protein n=1 Tax=Adineta steineri TaxID=433720 RepID=A0A818RQX3_9BILA|nr:unnamed protein product [Adineta steineri]CAF1029102.1 unnamed protein product [Adineta steineri]CAF3657803.1 unnamed protein product [Adineta steineri]CAF3697978.1 unnamed protein product [Adineta steineri]